MLPLVADRYLVRLRLTGPARFHFHHGGVLRGLLSRALRTHALPTGLVPFASELGRVRFEPDDPYHLGWSCPGLTDTSSFGRKESADAEDPSPVLSGVSPSNGRAGAFWEIVELAGS